MSGEDENMKPKPLEYWRDRLDFEIIDAVNRGQRARGFGANGITLSKLAEERLLEILVCGGSEKHAALEEAKMIARQENKKRAEMQKEIDARMKENKEKKHGK